MAIVETVEVEKEGKRYRVNKADLEKEITQGAKLLGAEPISEKPDDQEEPTVMMQKDGRRANIPVAEVEKHLHLGWETE